VSRSEQGRAETETAEGERSPTPVGRVRRLIRISNVAAVVGLGAGVFAVLAQLSGLKSTANALLTGSPFSLAAMGALETVSLMAYGFLTRTALGVDRDDLSEGHLQLTVLVGTGLGRVMPGGTVGAMAVTVKALTGPRRPGLVVATTLAAAGFVSSAVLFALLMVSIIPLLIANSLAGRIVAIATAASVFAVLVVAVFTPAMVWPERVGSITTRILKYISRGPLKHLDPVSVGEQVTHAAERGSQLFKDPSKRVSALLWATVNWVSDMIVLMVAAISFGGGKQAILSVPLAYALSMVAAALPTTPGGVGVVEGVATGVLTAGGVPAPNATAAVLAWRLISHWLPIALGLALLPTLARSNMHDGLVDETEVQGETPT
jgi:uncharacterized protein (TIRG00374 family)